MFENNSNVLTTESKSMSEYLAEIRDIILDAHKDELEGILTQSFYINYYQVLCGKSLCERLKMFKTALIKFDNDTYADLFEQWQQSSLPKKIIDKKTEMFFNRFLLLCASLSGRVDEHILTM